ncbi:helicase-associated domain-containing protein [Rhodococcus sp. I2R]|uniref:helicase-associated domain-containing protein n=1 Tax=Rhodococcus sp. I2R TaxID=2855445 RepID=UPI001E494B3D|nr:helicase-associated domain-containing protein [Rhodococcus sp. I2R]MCC8929136.1 helicase-associated domain-containing protein [Rhodococcus sp. I2R]
MTTYEDWLAGLGADRLETLLRLRRDVALDPPPRTFDSLKYLLHTPRSITAALRSVDRSALLVLAALDENCTRAELGARFDEGGKNTTEDIDRALAELVDRGIVWPSAAHSYRTSPLDGRTIDIDTVPHLAPPPLRPIRVSPPSSQQLALARYCDTADAVLTEVDSGSVPVLKSRGIGARVVKSLAKTVKDDELVVELVLTLGAAAGLITAEGDLARCTTSLAAWRESEREVKWARSVALWWCSGGSPTNRAPSKDKATPVLRMTPHWPSTTRLRHRMIAEMPSAGVGSEREAAAFFEWAMPDLVDEAQPGDVAAIWREAMILGVLVDGSPSELSSELGRLVSAEVEDVVLALKPAARRIVDSSACTLHLLPDLTAVVAGPVSDRISALLTASAEAESKDAASTWRFTPTSVHRCLDAGGTAEGLLAELSDTAATVIPQSLEYLINDCARRHGIAEAMFDCGYAPLTPTAGSPTSAKATPSSFADRSLLIERTGFDPATLAAHLVSGTPVEVDLDRVAHRLRAGAGLPARDCVVLAGAVSHGEPVAVDLVDRKSGIVRDELRDAVLDAGVVHAWSLRANGRRSIELTSIRMVRALRS